MAERKLAEIKPRKGRQAPPGLRRQFLATMDAEVIKALKTAALEDDTTASEYLETATKEFLERRKAERGRKR
ncbi:hypothetical protein ACVIGB_000482 [Bradyrhizobium sp. USDA 4341]